MKEFNSLKIKDSTLQNIMFLGFEEMTPIQRLALPIALSGKDLIGQAKTGTGKTFAFAIPLIEKIHLEKKGVQAIVLTPTRELAVQVGLEIEKLIGSSVDVALCYGGAAINPQTKKLKEGAHIVVGTPGRVMDHIRRGNLELGEVETFILDEADRMLDMGFIKDVEWIMSKTPSNRQTMLFSATMPDAIKNLSKRYLHDPEFISASSDEDELTVEDIEQVYYEVPQKTKVDSFVEIMKKEKPEKSLIFCKTKSWVEKLYSILKKKNFSVERIHGDMTQAAREKAIEKLKDAKVKHIVCTDVVARGLDIYDITHVFNYDLPQEPMTYVHRIGRTARAGKKGKSITLINPGQIHDLWMIEHHARTKIDENKLENN